MSHANGGCVRYLVLSAVSRPYISSIPSAVPHPSACLPAVLAVRPTGGWGRALGINSGQVMRIPGAALRARTWLPAVLAVRPLRVRWGALGIDRID